MLGGAFDFDSPGQRPAARLTLAELADADLAKYRRPLRQAHHYEAAPLGAPPVKGTWLRTGLAGDVRSAYRSLLRTPLQTATIIISLVIGSTFTVLMFGVVNTMIGGTMPGVRQRAPGQTRDRAGRPLSPPLGDG